MEFEEGSGLYYYRLRYYDAAAGRFISRDPLGMWGDPGQRGNAQNYCGNNPVNRVDPLGLGPNQEEAIDPEMFLDAVRMLEEDLRKEKGRAPTPSETLEEMSDNQYEWLHYVYTNGLGWLDMSHFVRAGHAADGLPDPLVDYCGRFVEWWQYLFGFFTGIHGTGSSGLDRGQEDIISNAAGILFGDAIGEDEATKRPVSDQLADFFKKFGAIPDKRKAPGFSNLPESEDQTEYDYQVWRRREILDALALPSSWETLLWPAPPPRPKGRRKKGKGSGPRGSRSGLDFPRPRKDDGPVPCPCPPPRKSSGG